MPSTVTREHREKRRAFDDRAFDVLWADENIAREVARTVARSQAFRRAVEGDGPPLVAARDLVPCERCARGLLARYISRAREELAAHEGAWSSAVMGVMQLGLRIVKDVQDSSLSGRTKRPHYARLTESFEILERVLSGRCAVVWCDEPALRTYSSGAVRGGEWIVVRRAATRSVCCSDHEQQYGRKHRRRLHDLLALAASTVDAGIDEEETARQEYLADVRGLDIAPARSDRHDV
jgi:hypothetical protein